MGWAADKTPEQFFMHGHHFALMPDGSCDDFDIAIPDYYVHVMKCHPDAECVGSNGSDMGYEVSSEGKLTVAYDVYDREYDDGTEWNEKRFNCLGKLTEHDGYMVFKVEEIRVGGSL